MQWETNLKIIFTTYLYFKLKLIFWDIFLLAILNAEIKNDIFIVFSGIFISWLVTILLIFNAMKQF